MECDMTFWCKNFSKTHFHDDDDDYEWRMENFCEFMFNFGLQNIVWRLKSYKNLQLFYFVLWVTTFHVKHTLQTLEELTQF